MDSIVGNDQKLQVHSAPMLQKPSIWNYQKYQKNLKSKVKNNRLKLIGSTAKPGASAPDAFPMKKLQLGLFKFSPRQRDLLPRSMNIFK